MQEGGDLATVLNTNENQLLYDEFIRLKADQYSAYSAWIGLATRDLVASTTLSNLIWLITGQNPPWYNFPSGEPNNASGRQGICGGIIVKAPYFGKWDDGECSIAQAFACEIGE